MADLLQSYFSQLRSVKPATKEDIDKFWIKAKKGNKQAISRIIDLNYCLVIPIAKKYARRGVDFMDLISDGNIGLMKAVEKFDISKNVKFSTYATYWIEQYIRRSIEDNSKTIRVPAYMHDIINKWKKTRNMLLVKLNREPTTQEIAKKAKFSLTQAEEINKIIYSTDNISSLDMSISSEDEEITKKDVIPDVASKTPEAVSEIVRTSERIQEALKFLPERQCKIIELRYGIGGTHYYSLDEVGKILNISRERVRQLEMQAYQKLKGIFLKLKFYSKEVIDKLILDQRAARIDAELAKGKKGKKKFKERRKAWC